MNRELRKGIIVACMADKNVTIFFTILKFRGFVCKTMGILKGQSWDSFQMCLSAKVDLPMHIIKRKYIFWGCVLFEIPNVIIIGKLVLMFSRIAFLLCLYFLAPSNSNANKERDSRYFDVVRGQRPPRFSRMEFQVRKLDKSMFACIESSLCPFNYLPQWIYCLIIILYISSHHGRD